MNTEMYLKVDKYFKGNDIKGAVSELETMLSNQPGERFKYLIGNKFTNTPDSIVSSINQFTEFCDKTFDIKAIYLEMNGFDINFDRWYFDSFGYKECNIVEDDFEWLCDWESEKWNGITLTGFESVQKDFEWYQKNRIWKQKDQKEPYDLAVLLVMSKFVQLVESAILTGKLKKKIPVLATAHEFETIGIFKP